MTIPRQFQYWYCVSFPRSFHFIQSRLYDLSCLYGKVIKFSIASHVIRDGSFSTVTFSQKEGIELSANAYSILKHLKFLIVEESINFKTVSESRKLLFEFYFNIESSNIVCIYSKTLRKSNEIISIYIPLFCPQKCHQFRSNQEVVCRGQEYLFQAYLM